MLMKYDDTPIVPVEAPVVAIERDSCAMSVTSCGFIANDRYCFTKFLDHMSINIGHTRHLCDEAFVHVCPFFLDIHVSSFLLLVGPAD